VKNFVKQLDSNGQLFLFLYVKFRTLIMEKIRLGEYICPQIRQLFRDPQFKYYNSKKRGHTILLKSQ